MRGRIVLVAALMLATRSPADTRVSNLSEAPAGYSEVDSYATATSFTTGPAPAGTWASSWALNSITVLVGTSTDARASVGLRADNAGSPGALLYVTNVDLFFPASSAPLTAYVGGVLLRPNTKYWVTLGETPGFGDFQWWVTGSANQSSPSSWTIGDDTQSSSDGGQTWLCCSFGAQMFSIDATPAPDLAVADYTRRAILRVDRATGNRTVISGCIDAGCTSEVGTGRSFGAPLGVVQLNGNSIVVADADPNGPALIRVALATGNRTLVTGCNPGCGTGVGAGRDMVYPYDVSTLGSSLFAVDYSFGDANGALASVNLATGNRTTVSGCIDDACSSLVGSGRNFVGPVGIIRDLTTNPTSLLVVERAFPSGSPLGVTHVDPANGNRTVVSGCVDVGCTTIAGSGPMFIAPNIGDYYSGALVVPDSGLQAIVGVDLATGNRNIFSGCSDPSCTSQVGSGPAFTSPLTAKLATNNSEILVADANFPGILSVDLFNGNRTVVSSASVGSGPLGIPTGMTELPEPGRLSGLAASLAVLALLATRRRTRARRVR